MTVTKTRCTARIAGCMRTESPRKGDPLSLEHKISCILAYNNPLIKVAFLCRLVNFSLGWQNWRVASPGGWLPNVLVCTPVSATIDNLHRLSMVQRAFSYSPCSHEESPEFKCRTVNLWGQETEGYVCYLPKVEERTGPWLPNRLLAGLRVEGCGRQEDSVEVAMQYVCQVQG